MGYYLYPHNSVLSHRSVLCEGGMGGEEGRAGGRGSPAETWEKHFLLRHFLKTETAPWGCNSKVNFRRCPASAARSFPEEVAAVA